MGREQEESNGSQTKPILKTFVAYDELVREKPSIITYIKYKYWARRPLPRAALARPYRSLKSELPFVS